MLPAPAAVPPIVSFRASGVVGRRGSGRRSSGRSRCRRWASGCPLDVQADQVAVEHVAAARRRAGSPSPELPEITLPAPGVGPPMVELVEVQRRIPTTLPVPGRGQPGRRSGRCNCPGSGRRRRSGRARSRRRPHGGAAGRDHVAGRGGRPADGRPVGPEEDPVAVGDRGLVPAGVRPIVLPAISAADHVAGDPDEVARDQVAGAGDRARRWCPGRRCRSPSRPGVPK